MSTDMEPKSPAVETAEETPQERAGLDRREAVATLLRQLPDALVVTGLGSPSYDAFAAGERPTNFHLWGAMGGAVPVGLGLALAQPDRSVVVITGDGEQLMGMGSLATVGAAAPRNLTVVVLDNGRFGETGMQRSHTALGTDLPGVAHACGLPEVRRITELDELGEAARMIDERRGPGFVQVVIAPSEPPRTLPPRDGVANKNAFRAGLGLPTF